MLFAITALTLAAQFACPTEASMEVVAAPAAVASDTQTRVKTIAPGQSQRWTINDRATRLDAIAVAPGRSRGLRMYLFDAEGKLLASDEDASDGLGFRVRDGWKGPFTLVVKNASREDNMYRLMVE